MSKIDLANAHFDISPDVMICASKCPAAARDYHSEVAPITVTAKKKRADSQMSGLAAEFFVAAELLKRDIQTSVTFGNAKSVDLLAYSSVSGKTFVIQVKALRKQNYFPIDPQKIFPDHIYVFVLLNIPGVEPEYFIVPGADLKNDPLTFDKDFLTTVSVAGISSRSPKLRTFKNNWQIFS